MSFPFAASLIAEVAQALYFTTLWVFINNLKAFMVSNILSLLWSEICCSKKRAAPNRIGARSYALFLKRVSLPFSSIIVAMKRLRALDRMSVAAYFFMESILVFKFF